ncbi:protein CURVATURE THYLAKOID 1D [Populus alba x Populus x berolinensis]|uniref:Cyanobacterial aminoacyl-tRNA synthetase CAAD domain-containing protein n=1 Tax=Populus davidiana TaxID=266767 RepID=A0A6M2EJ01_9ROSI|nr:protein CURVATURE THYLAKOID 1D [Populus alba x Populus x berolinensis]
MELCSTTPCISNHPKFPYHFRPKASLSLQKTLIPPTSRRRLYSRIRATFSEEPNQYVKEDRNGAVAVEESPALTETETEEATAAQVSDEFFFKLFDPEDAYSVLFYASGALVVFWLVVAVVGAIDSIPLFPKLMEVVGLGYTTWFAARYLLFKKNRDELAAEVAEFKQQVLGSDDD